MCNDTGPETHGDAVADEFEECLFCCGTGRVDGRRCSACAGHGTVLVEPEEENEED